MRRRPWVRVAVMATLVVATGAFAAWLGRQDPELWRLPGSSIQEPDTFPAGVGAGWRTLIRWDFGLVAAVSATLLAGIAISSPGRPPWTLRTWRGRHLSAAVVATVGYAVADVLENRWLAAALTRLESGRGVSERDAREIARAMASKWGFLVAAVLLVVALWPRRVPGSDTFRPSWGRPTDRPPPPGPPHAWDPDPNRFGISVSGGGIRSASFALGVLQVLRKEGLLQRARYVTSVSGGSYTTSAYAAMNQPWHGEGGPSAGPDDGFAPTSAEEQALRRSLRYLATDRKVLLGAVARIVLGLLINLWLLYLLTFAVVRPIGWLIGTPFVQRGLRVEDVLAVSVAGRSDDPDIDPEDQPYLACGLAQAPDDADISFGEPFTVSGEPDVPAVEVFVEVPSQCIRTVDPPSTGRASRAVPLRLDLPGVVAIVDGEAEVRRQPVVSVDDEDAEDLVTVVQPRLEVDADEGGLPDDPSDDLLAEVVSLDRAASVAPVSILDRRGDLDFDTRHWLLPGIPFLAAVLLLAWRTIGRPNWSHWLNGASAVLGAVALVLTLVMLVLPWLVDALPDAIGRGIAAGPPDDALGDLPGVPIDLTGLPSLLAWPLLSIVAVTRFLGARKGRQPDTRARARNARAFSKKYFAMARQLLVGLVLVAIAVVSASNILAVGAMSGPGAQLPWISREVLGQDFARWLPRDLVLWFAIVLFLVVTSGASESTSWSPAPIYKRRLAWAFAWARSGDGAARRRRYGPGDRWADFESRDPNLETDPAAGFVDGRLGDGTELVLCCAANVMGEDRAPTGRRAVSFSASRSVIGGPEIGWLSTKDYIERMGRRRKWDVNLPGITALSGAAVSPAMGKSALGPVGSILAILNVRLGAWLPHPERVGSMLPGEVWEHNPGWPWYWREVIRRYRSDAPYLYVTDGGHWENLGLVEAFRRGCTTIVAISAAGDGELSNATLAEAVEIARSDLGVDVELDEAWFLRPRIGGDPEPTLGSGRQYILEPGPAAELGRVAPRGYAFGTFRYASAPEIEGQLLLLEATMVDGLPVDVHAYAEGHAEFPNTSTGDQLFSHRDFESYRTLGRTIVTQALATPRGRQLAHRIRSCTRT